MVALDKSKEIEMYKTAAKFADDIIDSCFSDFEFYGIRGQNRRFEIVGSTMTHKSVMWFSDSEDSDDGTPLDGVCAIDIFNIPKDIFSGANYYPYEHFAILGSHCADVGYDDGEIIMREPVIVKILC